MQKKFLILKVFDTQPDFEQVAEDVKPLRCGGSCLQKIDEYLYRLRSPRVEMTVGNEQVLVCHDLYSAVSLLATDCSNGDGLERYILMSTLVTGSNSSHGVDHVHAFDDLAENSITPALH